MSKKIFLPIGALLIFCAFATAQNIGALTIFSENGEKFYLILNGLRQNNVAQTNVRVDRLNQPSYTAKIIFEDKSLPDINRNYLMIEDANHAMMDVTYKIKHDKNGMPKLGMMPTSFIPYQQEAIPAPDVYVVHYGTPDPMPATTTVQTTTTTTEVVPNATSATVNVNGMNMGVTTAVPNATTVQTTTTRTTTTSTEGVPAANNSGMAAQGCTGAYPMAQGDFNSAISTIKNQGFEETKLSTAKQIASGNCLSAGQITEICKTFGFEDTKLQFAKFAYAHCTEPNNYFKINNVFGFSSSTDELNNYIQGKQ